MVADADNVIKVLSVRYGLREVVQWLRDLSQATGGRGVGSGEAAVGERGQEAARGGIAKTHRGGSWNRRRVSCSQRMLPKAERRRKKDPCVSFPPPPGSSWGASWQGGPRHRPSGGQGVGRADSQRAHTSAGRHFLNSAIPRLSLFCTSRWMLSWLASVFLVLVLDFFIIYNIAPLPSSYQAFP